ncbi:uncharacterized protein LOC124452580 isoform X2 [Xenia sp. Carnegie-2017]|uniref:uncharacterized protein LOC124452580 isoform X2 n=1 Tax=Xenia sp. Carnegie-2017 TaxID=2897299 RepID=UPI001F040EE2|nr:uncharacterized protein LOC124452580 isoform X2 [Xenia sp. Carnegie-2017]
MSLMKEISIKDKKSSRQLLTEEDLDYARRLAKSLKSSSKYDEIMIRNIIDHNWDTEPQMVSNLLHFPLVIPKDLRLPSLLRGLSESERPYYILAASNGLSSLDLSKENDTSSIKEKLKEATLRPQGDIAIHAFMALGKLLRHPEDTEFVLRFLHCAKSTLHYNALTWILVNVKDVNEVRKILENKAVPEDIREEGLERLESDLIEDLNQNEGFTYTPSLADFEAMRRKEQTLSEIFTELDTDKDGKIGAEEILSFCEDIGRVMTLDKVEKDIKHYDTDKDGKIVKDEWIELMFPQFNVQ